jgi:hypothetical protein
LISALRHAAARKIQKNWKLFNFIRMVPNMRKRKSLAGAKIIQKYMRGYLASKHTLKQLADTKLDVCYDYFNEIKKWRELSAQIYLAYFMRRYIRIKRRQEAEYNEAVARNKIKKKHNNGTKSHPIPTANKGKPPLSGTFIT